MKCNVTLGDENHMRLPFSAEKNQLKHKRCRSNVSSHSRAVRLTWVVSKIVLRNWNHAFHGQCRVRCHFQQGDMKKNRNLARKCCPESIEASPLAEAMEVARETFSRGIVSRTCGVRRRAAREIHNSRSIVLGWISGKEMKSKFAPSLYSRMKFHSNTHIRIDHSSSIDKGICLHVYSTSMPFSLLFLSVKIFSPSPVTVLSNRWVNAISRWKCIHTDISPCTETGKQSLSPDTNDKHSLMLKRSLSRWLRPLCDDKYVLGCLIGNRNAKKTHLDDKGNF